MQIKKTRKAKATFSGLAALVPVVVQCRNSRCGLLVRIAKAWSAVICGNCGYRIDRVPLSYAGTYKDCDE